MNIQQRRVYDEVIESVINKTGGLYFLYGHGGTRKTYVWNSIITRLRFEGKIILAIASYGIAYVLLPKGRTTHSRFQILNLLKEYSTCVIKLGTPETNLVKNSSLIIWDEEPMVHMHAFEAVDRTLRDIFGRKDELAQIKPFGGLTVVLGGDFRQILPVLPRGNKHDILNASISSSRLWNKCKLFALTQNMRLQQIEYEDNDMLIDDFGKWVLNLGNGDLQ
ncbi:uncharacterized protein LOC109846187 [Asparagus officinalis]|uniref:uncharacterized protein LOC109846187 n=1 Tax=Asparagus officinalis TaxID=4686 RepID=UPI00098DF181|nr:uncharacterized protein LOC109846187 [Asparagus officinalis]